MLWLSRERKRPAQRTGQGEVSIRHNHNEHSQRRVVVLAASASVEGPERPGAMHLHQSAPSVSCREQQVPFPTCGHLVSHHLCSLQCSSAPVLQCSSAPALQDPTPTRPPLLSALRDLACESLPVCFGPPLLRVERRVCGHRRPPPLLHACRRYRS